MENCLGNYNEADDLRIDECLININYTGIGKLRLFSVYEACYKCAYQYCQGLKNGFVVYKTQPSQRWRIEATDTRNILCDNLELPLGEFGVYDLNLEQCEFKTLRAPANIYLPLLIPLGIFVFGLIFMVLRKRWFKQSEEDRVVSTRIKSVDVFRGITITFMIFVNDGGGGYEIIDHVVWNGLHVADVIFPWFVWIMGFCISIALQSEYKRSQNRWIILKHVVQRSLTLFILGLTMNTVASGPNLDNIRIMGVLQRLAVSYLFGSLIYMIGLKRKNNIEPKKSQFADILKILPEWGIVIVICVIHTSIIFLIQIPGCPTGYLGPGGWHLNETYRNCTGGVTKYIDELILTKAHMYQYPAIAEIYNSSAFDPENILGCLPSIVQVFLGIQAGVTLRTFSTTKQRLTRWVSWGVVTLILSCVLCGFQIENGWIPINKNLWSLSFVLVTTSLGLFVLSLCFYVIDEKRYWSGKPFLFMGMNSTLMFLGHMVCYQMFPFHFSVGGMNTHLIRLVENLWSTVIWIVISYVLWKKKYFFKL